MRKKLMSFILALMLMMPVTVKANGSVDIYVDEKLIVMEEKARLVEDDIYIPLRSVMNVTLNGETMEKLPKHLQEANYKIEWDEEESKVTLTVSSISDYRVSEAGVEEVVREELGRVEFVIGQRIITVNGEERLIDDAPMLIAGRSMLPLEAITKEFNADMFFDEELNEVWIDIEKIDIPGAYFKRSSDTVEVIENEEIENIKDLEAWVSGEDLLSLKEPIEMLLITDEEECILVFVPYKEEQDAYKKEEFILKIKGIGKEFLDDDILEIDEEVYNEIRIKKEDGKIHIERDDFLERLEE